MKENEMSECLTGPRTLQGFPDATGMKYQLETMREIWPDRGDGEHLEIGPDRDGTEMVEIRQREPDGKISARITIDPDAARLLAVALNSCAEELSSAN